MKIKADRMCELEKFGFIPCMGGIFIRKNIAIWKDGKIIKVTKNNDVSYYKHYVGKFLVKDLISAGMVEL